MDRNAMKQSLNFGFKTNTTQYITFDELTQALHIPSESACNPKLSVKCPRKEDILEQVALLALFITTPDTSIKQKVT